MDTIKKYASLLALAAAAFAPLPAAAQTPNNAPAPDAQLKSDISYSDAAILGLVEGITEYLPISSTGHLILTNALLGLDSGAPLVDSRGLNIMKTESEPYTLKSLADSYAIVIQFGAIASVAMLYWRLILAMLLGLVGRNPQGLRLFVNIMAAFMPAAAVGLALHKAIEAYLFGVGPVIAALAAGAVLMAVAQKKYDADKGAKKLALENLTVKKSLAIGALQCVALIPGTSRSMMTILGGYIVGMDAKNSATFSFLLGLATLTAASGYKAMKDGHAMAEALSLWPLTLGLAVAFISSMLAVRWLVGFLTRRGLVPFAIYRLALAAALSAALYWDLI